MDRSKMPSFVDTLLCELVRAEANGKLSLLGLFGDAMLVPSIPIVLASLAFVQRWRPNADERPGTKYRSPLNYEAPASKS
jgi:hypothetical protein